ncbi:hypothetical protein [Kitasatospora sp. NPDC058190]|uniref:hypothetical protein n=1 Tax=Kitasatospora sp. NPDC058190 TaxID=3346371 RepID=UPI0036D8B4B8
MTSHHPAATDPALPGPPADGAGSSLPAAVPTGTAVATAPAAPAAPAATSLPDAHSTLICSIATAAEGGVAPAGATRQSCAARHDSVPRPRTAEDTEAYLAATAAPAAAEGDPTTARLRAAFADRLRAARAEGRSLTELAAACRRPVEEVRALLGEEAGDDPTEQDAPAGDTGPGFVRLQQPATPAEANRPAPAPRSAREELRSFGSRRPSPSRRLRRMHPQADRTGQEAAARETAATYPAGAEPRGAGWVGELTGATGAVADHALPAAAAEGAFGVPSGASFDASFKASSDASFKASSDASFKASSGARTGTGAGAGAGESRTEPPLGILIGGSPGQPDAVGRAEERTPVRAAAEPIRIGRGTSLIVLPSWRPAIAVSVSTEQLLAETGLTVEQLADAQLTVMMSPWALHDRELDLHGWESGPAAGRGRRGGRG